MGGRCGYAADSQDTEEGRHNSSFDAGKIENAILEALEATKTPDKSLATYLTGKVLNTLAARFRGKVPTVENVQDIVEEVLMAEGHPAVAKAYILYREKRAEIRRMKGIIGVRDDMKLGVNAVKVLERRYLLRDQDGNLIESPRELFHRVAHTVAGAAAKAVAVIRGADRRRIRRLD